MTSTSEVKTLVQNHIPGAEVQVEDMTGTSDHFQIMVISPVFKGKLLIDQHRLVQQALDAAFADGRIHAVHITTETPESWAKKQTGGKNDFKILH